MKRFKNILLVHDLSGRGDAALQRAMDLAKHNQARLTVIDIIDDLPRYKEKLLSGVLHCDLLDLIRKERLAQLHDDLTPFLDESVAVTAKVFHGKPFLEIIREVLRNNHDLVIKTASGKGLGKSTLFGSTAMHLLRKCPCPLWMMAPEKGGQYQRILAAIDLEPALDEKKIDALNLQIMEMAVSLAYTEAGDLHIVQAWQLFGEKIMKHSHIRSLKDEVKSWLEAQNQALQICQEEFQTVLDHFLESNDMVSLQPVIHQIKGDASEVIPRLAREKRVDLVVMGTLARTGLAGFLMGNTAESILSQIDCSVLAIKPQGFVSPVTL